MALSNSERSRAYDERNREKRRLAAAARRAANPERTKEIKRSSYLKHAEANKAYAAEWRARNPEIVRGYERDRDKDRQRERAREWKRANPERCREYARAKLQSVDGRLANRIRARVNAVLKSGGKSRTLARLGYTSVELRAHLERQFLKGMNWENMGEWHIDHIVPLSSFNITSADDPEFLRAWALTNLRPLWARDNVRKSAKRTHLI